MSRNYYLDNTLSQNAFTPERTTITARTFRSTENDASSETLAGIAATIVANDDINLLTTAASLFLRHKRRFRIWLP